ncbi:MAG: CBS domain-containing protein [Gammaproteobacteria bacterium]
MACKIENMVYETAEALDESVFVYEAAELMAQYNLGSIMVTSGGTVIGLFTERDLITRVIGLRKDPAETRLADVCTRNLISITTEATCEEAIKLMGANKCRRLVVYKNNTYQGMVSLPKVAQAMAHKGGRDFAVNFVFAISLATIIGFLILLSTRLPDMIELARNTQ